MAFDITPGFNLGISDTLRRIGRAGNSFKGSTNNQVVFSNPYGLSAQNQPATQPQKNASSPQVQGAETGPYRGSGGGSSSGGGGGAQYDPTQLAMIDQGIGSTNNALGLLDRQQEIGLGNIGNQFNANLSRLLGSKAQAERNYNTTKQQSTQDNVNTRNDINASVGRNANALQRLLGQRGAGNSSAAQIVAPYGAALQGTQQLRGVTDAFGRNMQALDTNFGDFNTEWQQSREDLDRQRFQGEQGLRGDVAGKRAGLLSSLGQLQAQRAAARGGSSAAALAAAQPFINQANSLQSQIVELGNQYANPINVQAPTYANPELAQYGYDQGTGPSIDNSSAYTDTIAPSLVSLLHGRRNQNQPQF